MNIDVLTPEGATAGTVELPADLFDVQVNVPLIHQVVVAQLAAARQGTADTKTRAEVSGGGRKPYKQKGTGRARQGSIRAPQFTGGGVVHGPTPRDYAQRTPKKMKAAALRGALSDRARNGRVHVISSIVAGEVPSAKSAAAALATISDRPNLLVVVSREDIIGWKSLRNLNNVHLIVVDQLNTYDVLCSDDVVFTADALETFVETRSSGVSAPAASPVAKVRAAVKAATAKVVEEVAEEVEEVAEKVESLAHRVEKKAEEVASRAAKVGDAKEPVAQAPAPKVEAPAAKPEVEAEAEAEPVKAEPVKAEPVKAEPAKAETAEAEPAEVATPEVATANVTTAAVATPEVETPEVEAPKVAAPKVVAPKATETDEEVDQ